MDQWEHREPADTMPFEVLVAIQCLLAFRRIRCRDERIQTPLWCSGTRRLSIKWMSVCVCLCPREERNQTQVLRQQQDEAYLVSLRADQEKDRKRREEQEQKRLEEEKVQQTVLAEERRRRVRRRPSFIFLCGQPDVDVQTADCSRFRTWRKRRSGNRNACPRSLQ